MRVPFNPALVLAVAAFSFGACTCGDKVDPDDNPDPVLADLKRITLAPASVTLTSADGVAATQAFTVTGHYEDESTKDLTEKATLAVDDSSLGTFVGTTFRASTETGGTTAVRATIDTFSTEAEVTVVLKRSVKDDGPGSDTLPNAPGTIFDQAPEVAGRAPQLVYPNDGVLVPPNLSKLEFHFRKRHADNSLFELSFTNAVTDLRVFLRCHMPAGVRLPDGVSDGCIYTPSPAVWAWIAQTNRGGEPLTVRVRGTDDTGTGVGASDTLEVQIARSELKGALYYWSTTDTEIKRYDFAGPPDAAVETAISRADAGNRCVGCHALSRDGKKIFATTNGQHNGNVLLYDLGNDAPLVPFDSTSRLQFVAWNRDSSRFVGVYGDNGATNYGLMMFDGTNGQYLHGINGTGTEAQKATHPEWAPDDSYLLWTRAGQSGVTNQRPTRGEIQGLKVLGDNAYGDLEVIIPRVSGKNHYYPAVAPDSKYLVYNQSTCPSGDVHIQCNGDTDPTAMLWAAKLAPSAQQIQLARANAGGVLDGSNTALVNTYPKWSPFEVVGSNGPDSRLHWLTFASARQYGLRSVNPASGEYTKGTWVWMAAVDPDKVAAGQDGSYPAFAMPYQDLSTSNHIAQWAQYAVVDGCRTDGDGCGAGGATCCNGLSCTPLETDPPLPCEIEGNCVCRPVVTCTNAGGACASSGDCCNSFSCNNVEGGGACSGPDCVCQPPCGASGDACGGASGACCGGLICLSEAGGACDGADCACRISID